MSRPNIPALTSLRIFAALLVVIFHYDLGAHPKVLVAVSHFGYQSVTFFFVLSGFILTYVHLDVERPDRLNLTAVAFMAHRISRIFPAYLLGLTLSAPFFIESYLHGHTPGSQFISGLILVPTGLQAWFPGAALLWNYPAWSLSVEFFLYMSFTPLVRTVARTREIRFLIATYLVLCVVAFARTHAEGTRPADISATWWSNFINLFPLWHLPQFIFGVALGRLFVSGVRISRRVHDAILLVSAVVIGSIVLHVTDVPMLSSNAVLAPIFGALIFGAAGSTGLLSKILSIRPLVLLGDASYATYIVHIPLWMLWYRFTVVDLRINFPPFEDFFCYLVIVVGASIAAYTFIERPARRWLLLHMRGVTIMRG